VLFYIVWEAMKITCKGERMKKAKENFQLSETEILVILRAADDIIAQGGRTLLSKILKGSKEMKLLELGLNLNPSYGFFNLLSMDEVLAKIDWMLLHDFLEIQFSGKLPMIVFTEKGWTIEREQYTDEFMRQWDQWIAKGYVAVDKDMQDLKDRNRGMMLLFLQKIQASGNKAYIPYLQAWELIEYKKMKQAIREVIVSLKAGNQSSERLANERNDVRRLLEISPMEAERLKCWECGDRFIFEVEEQKFFKTKGFAPPKRCPSCREKKWLRELGIDDIDQ
jgi:hypothetical protein